MMQDGVAGILSCERLSKHYGSLAAVDELSFSVAPGEVLGIGGPNGAGKTTLFDVICGLSPPTGGHVLLGGRTITGLSADRVCRLGVARTFQLNAAFASLTMRENVEIAACFGNPGRRFPRMTLAPEARLEAQEALELVGLAARADRSIAEASVLERKLLMIASAVVTHPRVLLLDEPVGGLTPSEIERVMRLVRGLVDLGMTIVLIEHVMRFLLLLSTRVLVMHHGRKLFEGEPHRVAEDEEVRRIYLGDATAARLKHFFEPSGAMRG